MLLVYSAELFVAGWDGTGCVAVSAALTVAAAAALSRRLDKSTDQQKAGIYKFSTLFSVPLRPTLFI